MKVFSKAAFVWPALFSAILPLAAGIVSTRFSKAAAAAHHEPAAFEAGEDMPGGTATTPDSNDNRDAFSHFSHGIGLEGESKFKIGNAIFRRQWVSAPSSTTSADGLGPLYNARACQNCHLKDGRGRPPAKNWPDEVAASMFLRLSIPPETDEQKKALADHRLAVVPEPVYGTQLQNIAIKGLSAEGQMRIEYSDEPVTLGDGTVVTLRKPTYSVVELGFGPLHPKTMLSPRVAPPMIGLGLLQAIPEAAIRAHADPDDANKDGISGRASEVWSSEKNAVTLGRFGWKAGAASIREQSAGAAAGDMGLSNPLHPEPSGECTPQQTVCINAPNGNSEASGGFELGEDLLSLIVFYSENLAVPRRRDPEAADVLLGKGIFKSAGCAQCHTPSFKTGVVEGQPHLSDQTIWPYTDLLLHDMGEGLADHRPEGVASGTEWRTSPLWGIGLTELVNGHTLFLHDGRARNLEEAILWHGGEAEASRKAYMALPKSERDALLKFVASL